MNFPSVKDGKVPRVTDPEVLNLLAPPTVFGADTVIFGFVTVPAGVNEPVDIISEPVNEPETTPLGL